MEISQFLKRFLKVIGLPDINLSVVLISRVLLAGG
jgi:hypothetical protein